MLAVDVAPVPDATGAPAWVAIATVATALVVALTPIILQRMRDRAAVREDGGADAKPQGLNAPIVATVTEATTPREKGVTGVRLATLLDTVEQLSDRVEAVEAEHDAAQKEIAELKRREAEWLWLLNAVVEWAVNIDGAPPRTLPAYLGRYLERYVQQYGPGK